MVVQKFLYSFLEMFLTEFQASEPWVMLVMEVRWKIRLTGRQEFIQVLDAQLLTLHDTLKVESFAGRNFRDFAIFFVDRES